MPQPHIFFGQPAGGGSGTLANIEQAGVPIVLGAITLNFRTGATVTNGGGGLANVDISGGGFSVVNYHTVTAPELAAKQFNLPSAPGTPALAMVDVIGGSSQQITVGYNIVGVVFSWNGLSLDGIIGVGDVIRTAYNP